VLRMNPVIERDEKFKMHIFRSLKTRYEEERVGIHATDLLWARQAVFRKLQGSRISERDVVFFALGAGEGEVAEELMGRRHEVIVIHNGIIHTVDSVITEGDLLIPVEIKTTRASPPSVKSHYLLQLGMYCLAMHVDHGKLVIFYLNDGVIEAYNVRYPAESLREIDRFEVERRNSILEALRLRDPLKAPYVAGDPELDWKCLSCQYWTRCSGRRISFRIIFPQPLMIGRIYEGLVLREAHRAGEHGCDVKLLRNGSGEIRGVEASGDVVKLVPLRRTVEEIQSKLSRI